MNIKNLFLFILGIIFLFSCRTPTTKEEKDSDSTVVPLQEIVTQDYSPPKELVYPRETKNILYDKFFPVGWSKNGKFAYFVEPADEARGIYILELVIKNINNEKIEFVWKPQEENAEGNFKTIWEKNYALFKTELNKHQIIQQNSFVLGKNSFTFNNKQFSIKLETKTKNNPDYGFDVIVGTYVSLEKQNEGAKMLYQYEERNYSTVLNAWVNGYFPSPYADKIIVLGSSERCGYEGPPNVITFFLASTDLNVGFKK